MDEQYVVEVYAVVSGYGPTHYLIGPFSSEQAAFIWTAKSNADTNLRNVEEYEIRALNRKSADPGDWIE